MRDAPRPVRCAIYTRQSVARPETAGLSSCVVQRELCEEFIAARRMEGWLVLPERFDDEGASGSTLERPALDRLLECIEEGRIDRVVICRLDRITRSLMGWVKLAETLKRHNVCLSSISGEGRRRGRCARSARGKHDRHLRRVRARPDQRAAS